MIFTTRESFAEALGREQKGLLVGEFLIGNVRGNVTGDVTTTSTAGKVFVFTRQHDVVLVLRKIWSYDRYCFVLNTASTTQTDLLNAIYGDVVWCAIWPVTLKTAKKMLQYYPCRWIK